VTAPTLQNSRLPSRSFRILLETPDGPCSFESKEDQYLWDAAAREGILLPSICRQGRCLTCAGRLLAGTVGQQDAESYFADDQAASFILLCRAKPQSDLHIRTHQEKEMRVHRIAKGLPAPYA